MIEEMGLLVTRYKAPVMLDEISLSETWCDVVPIVKCIVQYVSKFIERIIWLIE